MQRTGDRKRAEMKQTNECISIFHAVTLLGKRDSIWSEMDRWEKFDAKIYCSKKENSSYQLEIREIA